MSDEPTKQADASAPASTPPTDERSRLLNLKIPLAFRYDLPVAALLADNGVDQVVNHYAGEVRSLIVKLALEAASCGGWEKLLARLKPAEQVQATTDAAVAAKSRTTKRTSKP